MREAAQSGVLAEGEHMHVCVQRELAEAQKQWSQSEAQAAEAHRHTRSAVLQQSVLSNIYNIITPE